MGSRTVLDPGPGLVLVLVSGSGSVALSHGRPGRRQPGNGALELGVGHAHLAQAGVVHGGRRGHGEGGAQARVGGASQELGGQPPGDGARGGARGGEGGARHRPQAGVLAGGGGRQVRLAGSHDRGGGGGGGLGSYLELEAGLEVIPLELGICRADQPSWAWRAGELVSM